MKNSIMGFDYSQLDRRDFCEHQDESYSELNEKGQLEWRLKNGIIELSV